MNAKRVRFLMNAGRGWMERPTSQYGSRKWGGSKAEPSGKRDMRRRKSVFAEGGGGDGGLCAAADRGAFANAPARAKMEAGVDLGRHYWRPSPQASGSDRGSMFGESSARPTT